MEAKKVFKVSTADTAKALGSGGLEVLGTPALIAMIENTCFEALNEALSPSETSVGTKINLKHLRPSGVGSEIVVTVEYERSDRLVSFNCWVHEGEHEIATGKHQRVIVEVARFLQKL